MYYENGNIRLKTNYKDGKREGEFLRYEGNGQLKETTTYKDGKLVEVIKH